MEIVGNSGGAKREREIRGGELAEDKRRGRRRKRRREQEFVGKGPAKCWSGRRDTGRGINQMLMLVL